MANTGALGLYPLFRADDDDGLPLEGGKLWSYAAGTSTPQALYADAALTTPLANPVVLDAQGEALYYYGPLPYKLRLEDQFGVQQWEVDPVGAPEPPPADVWGQMLGGCVLGCGGVPQVMAATQLQLGAYAAYMPEGTYVEQPQVTVTLSGPDGRYWIALHADATTPVSGWTRFAGTQLLWTASVTLPVLPMDQLLLVAQVQMTAGALAQVDDRAPHRLSQPDTLEASMVTAGTWWVGPGASLTVPAGMTWTCKGQLLAPNQPGILCGPGTVKFGPTQPSNAVWFCDRGAGLPLDPWCSADGSGGMIQACLATGIHGTLRPAPGSYRYSSPDAAMFDLPVGVVGEDVQGDLTIDMRGVHLLVETTGTLFYLNKNGVIAATNTNLNTIHWTGGYFDTAIQGTAGLDSSCPIRGTAIDLTRTRVVTLQQIRFRGLEVAINPSVADSLTIRQCTFRRCYKAMYLPEVGRPDVPQDIYIDQNVGSQTGNDMDGCCFVDIATRVANLHITHNGVACSATNARFARLLTGGPAGDSLHVHITHNATEQYSTGSKLVEVLRYGTGWLRNLYIQYNQWEGPLAEAAPWASGQPYLDLSYLVGTVMIEGNDLTNRGVTAIKLDYLSTDLDEVYGLCTIRGNHFGQTAELGGRLFHITNVIGGAEVFIGRNAIASYYDGLLGSLVYPANQTRFELSPAYPAALAAANVLDVAPWDGSVRVTGTTPIHTITPTWKGHVLRVEMVTALGTMRTDVGNLRLQGDLTARSTALTTFIILICDGTLWTEQSRFNQVLTETVTAATTVNINSFSTLVGFSGSGTVETISGAKSGQLTVFRVPSGVTLKDKAATGNLRLPADVVGSANGTYILLAFDGSDWNATGPGQAA